jgi:hypothetical protein
VEIPIDAEDGAGHDGAAKPSCNFDPFQVWHGLAMTYRDRRQCVASALRQPQRDAAMPYEYLLARIHRADAGREKTF